jgi:hypothetical protein
MRQPIILKKSNFEVFNQLKMSQNDFKTAS